MTFKNISYLVNHEVNISYTMNNLYHSVNYLVSTKDNLDNCPIDE